MKRFTTASTLALVAAVVLGCGGPARSPSDVVAAYFRSLGADPLRTLPLLTPEFHRRHEIRVVTASDARNAANPGAGASEHEQAAALATDRFQLGWLAIQSRPELAKLARGLDPTVLDANTEGDTATVLVRVAPRGAPPFEQRFAVVRTRPGAPWRIDTVEQNGVTSENAAAAFVAYPNEAARRTLAGERAR